MQAKQTLNPDVFGSLLLDMGMALLRAGSTARRIRDTVECFASAYKYALHLDVGPKSISLSLLDDAAHPVFNGTRTTLSYGVNFKIISGIERMRASVTKTESPLVDLRNELSRLLKLPHYPQLIVLLVVSIAGGSFCYTFGGTIAEMGVTFGATFCGLFLKQELQKKLFNAYGCTFLAALVAALFTGIFYLLNKDLFLERAYVTCTLFLIPGVPLINACIDLLDGNILYGMERGVNAMMHALAIALGLSIALVIYNVPA